MKVTAISTAFYNGFRVRVGDIVDVPDNFKASWAVPITGEKGPAQRPAKGQAQRPAPTTLSEGAKVDTKTFVDAVGGTKADLA